MFNIIKKELNISIIASIIYIILGIIIVSNPDSTWKGIGIAVAILAIILGIIMTIINIKLEGNSITGILLIVIGIALIIYPSSLSILIALLIGIWFISTSISRIKLSIKLRKVKEVNWLVILIVSIITLLIGISFVFAPSVAADNLAIISGILMIVYSLCDVFEALFIKKNVRAIEKALK